jgi:hypothetical protein
LLQQLLWDDNCDVISSASDRPRLVLFFLIFGAEA